MQARSSEMAALLGGKMPHVMTSIPGGNMWVPTESKASTSSARHGGTQVRDWVNDTVLADTVMLAKLYTRGAHLRQGLRPLHRLGRLRRPRLALRRQLHRADAQPLPLPMAVLDEQFPGVGRAGEPHHRVHGPLLVQGQRDLHLRRTSSPRCRTSPSTTSTTATAG